MKEIFLLPGDYAAGNASCRISTLLGSCVAITLWHREKRVGAMSHFLLPASGRLQRDRPGDYGENVIDLMTEKLASLGVSSQACEAKIFGGGSMFAQLDLNGSGVGRQNGDMARRMLSMHGIPIAAESLYSTGYRKIVFDIGTGHVWMRHNALRSMHTINAPCIEGSLDQSV
jgi:chemotaxis protein CheD